MTKAMVALGGRVHLRAILAVAASALLSACSVQDVEVHQAMAGAPKVNAVQVSFRRSAMSAPETTIDGFGKTQPVQPYNRALVDRTISALNSALEDEFLDRFPETAKEYGLAVSPTAATILVVTPTSGVSRCSISYGCITRVNVVGVLADRNGRQLWTLSVTMLVGSEYKTATLTKICDELARKWLDALKNKGVIGQS